MRRFVFRKMIKRKNIFRYSRQQRSSTSLCNHQQSSLVEICFYYKYSRFWADIVCLLFFPLILYFSHTLATKQYSATALPLEFVLLKGTVLSDEVIFNVTRLIADSIIIAYLHLWFVLKQISSQSYLPCRIPKGKLHHASLEC